MAEDNTKSKDDSNHDKRQVWITDRKILLMERELDLKEAELGITRQRLRGQGWRAPLVVAVFAAAVAAGGNAVVSFIEGYQDRSNAADQAENARILEMIKAGDPDSAAINLQFLLDAGLVSNPTTVERLKTFLGRREPGTGPSLGSSIHLTQGIVGADDAVPTSKSGLEQVAALGKAVGQIKTLNEFGNETSGCTAFLIGQDRIATAAHCIASTVSAVFVLNSGAPNSEPRQFDVDLDTASASLPHLFGGGYVFIHLVQPLGEEITPLDLASNNYNDVTEVGMIYFRDTSLQLAVWGEPACRIVKIEAEEIYHTCDTGRGTSGAPLIDIESGEVIGIHNRRNLDGFGVAYRLGI